VNHPLASNRVRRVGPIARQSRRLSTFGDRFNASDTVLWNIERDPTLRTTIVAIAMLDRCPDWDLLRNRVLQVAQDVPRLRQRVVAAPFGIGSPRWQEVEHFDIDYHLRRVGIPPPGSFDALLDLAAPIAMAAFDKERPLWEFTLVEGLEGHRAALIEKVHHAFTDGVGGIQLARAFVDTRRDCRARRPQRRGGTAPRRPSPGVGRAALLEAAAQVAATMATAAHATQAALAVAASAVHDPLGLATRTARTSRSVGRLLAPATSPLSPIMRARGVSRRLAAFDLALADLLEAGHAVGGSLNDAFLAAIAVGMSRYHQLHGDPVGALRVTMPVNRRRSGDPLGQNRFTPVRFTIPVTCDEPAEQIRRIGMLAHQRRSEPALPISDVIATALNQLPVAATTAVFGSMLKGIDLVATNVPGFTDTVYLAGAEVVGHFAFAPPSGAAVSIALTSHRDVACIGITADREAVPDVDVLRDCLRAGFDDVLEVGRD
jgi:WS/DGAT/MGAT family acyltransferase